MTTPAISDKSIMNRFPLARRRERDLLIDHVDLFPGCKVVDLQAAGGYLSDGIYERLQGNVSCICVEPTPELNRRIAPHHTICRDPLHRLSSIADQSVDIVIGLAGLHHSDSILGTIHESWRILKPGGQFAVCDVELGSDVARWLNDYVNANNPAGHHGNFVHPGQISMAMREAGFVNLTETREWVPWEFGSTVKQAEFFKGLFGLNPDIESIRMSTGDYLKVNRCEGGILVDWTLIYASATKR